MSRRKPVKRRRNFHKKIKEKEASIRRSRDGGKVNFTDEEIKRVMEKYGVADYRIEVWGDISLQSKFSSWRISIDPDDEVIFLHHENKKLIRVGNERSSYHIHNVYYDLDYCVKSIIEHDEYNNRHLTNKQSSNLEDNTS